MRLRRLSIQGLPFALADLKVHCRIDAGYTGDDALITRYAWAAIKNGQNITLKTWVQTEYELVIEGEEKTSTGEILLPVSPATEIVSVSYSGAEGQVVNPEYAFTPSTIIPNSNPRLEVSARDPWDAILQCEWPGYSALTVTFKAGWPEPDFPEEFIQWLFVKIAGKYEQREDIASASRKMAVEFPADFADNLLNPYKRIVRM